jgi:phage major head subunit gpT-like protein
MLTPEWLMTLEDSMRVIQENEYASLAANTWWQSVARVIPSKNRKEIIHWLISTAYIRDAGYGGNITYDEIESTFTEVTNENFASGVKVTVNELEDLDSNGIQGAAKWASDMGQAFAFKPQEQVAQLLNTGETVIGYDKVAMFATNHPVNPVDTSSGLTFKNYFTGADALPIDESVTVEQALVNLATLYGEMGSIVLPNGKYPRRLMPYKILVPPKLMPRAAMLSNATLIAMAAGTLGAQGGSGDVSDLVKAMSYGTPVRCDEIQATLGGSDTTYYVLFAPMGTAQSVLGPVIYTQREPFNIIYHGPMTTAELARKREFQWAATGRNAVAPGHPFLIAKVEAS